MDLKSNAVPAGAVVGGALGLASGSGKSSSKKARNTLVGAAAGGAVASASQGSQKGMMYQVQVGTGDMIQVVSDQREIRTWRLRRRGKVGRYREHSQGVGELLRKGQ